jgi:hypothetical protein
MTTTTGVSPVLSKRASIVVLVLAVVTISVCWLIPPASVGDETGVTMALPDNISGLVGSAPLPVSQSEHEVLPPDTEFAGRTYGMPGVPENDGFDRVTLKIVLSGREKRSIHRPERCLPGQGWSVIGSQVVDVPLKSGHPLQVTALLLTRPILSKTGETRPLNFCYLYWYVGRKVSTPYSAIRVLLTNWDLIVHRSNQRWAYVIVAGFPTDNLVPGGRTQEQTLDELKRFIALAAPTFIKAEMPGEQTASR